MNAPLTPGEQRRHHIPRRLKSNATLIVRVVAAVGLSKRLIAIHGREAFVDIAEVGEAITEQIATRTRSAASAFKRFYSWIMAPPIFSPMAGRYCGNLASKGSH